jgi:hypothetical protein
MKRREIIKKGLTSAALFSIFGRLPEAGAVTPSKTDMRPVLAAFIDTLIPADTTPSASQLGLDKQLIAHAKSIENYTQLLTLGCQWLTLQSQASYGKFFTALSLPEREAVARIAESEKKGSIPRQFFERTLSDLMGFYYANPASWPGLGFDSPPQPKGYPDFQKKPAR